MFVLLTSIAAVHAYWAFGGLWPAQSEQELVDTVVGAPDLKQMPSTFSTLLVAVLIFMSGIMARAVNYVRLGMLRSVLRIGVGVLAIIFLARGAAGYALPLIYDLAVSEPFATLNAVFYSPLILLIGCGFAFLTFAKQ